MAQGFWDELFANIGDAVADIRQKVVEEGWFGRAITDDTQTGVGSFYRPVTQEPLASFEEQWMPRERSEAGRDIAGPEIER